MIACGIVVDVPVGIVDHVHRQHPVGTVAAQDDMAVRVPVPVAVLPVIEQLTAVRLEVVQRIQLALVQVRIALHPVVVGFRDHRRTVEIVAHLQPVLLLACRILAPDLWQEVPVHRQRGGEDRGLEPPTGTVGGRLLPVVELDIGRRQVVVIRHLAVRRRHHDTERQRSCRTMGGCQWCKREHYQDDHQRAPVPHRKQTTGQL